ncbi:MAG: anti-sigma factor antagonist [Deltaproteobacteria bacterium]|nr:MAG: anti-sigma factor antagonist [Deltaproteobacteria bacterium]
MPSVERVAGVTVITPTGDINHAEMVAVKNAIRDALAEGRRRLVLDLSEVDHINYMTLGVLVERAGRVERAGGALHIAGLSPYLERILRFSGVDDLFRIFESVEAAVAAHHAAVLEGASAFAGASGSWVPRMN